VDSGKWVVKDRNGLLRSCLLSRIFDYATMKRQRLVSQRSLSRMFQEAAEAWKRLNYQQSIEILERAAKMDPANARIQLDLGRAYGMRYDYSAAERCLEKGVRVAVQKAEALTEAGKRCQQFGRPDMAKAYFDRAVQEKGATAEVFLKLAELNERRARMEEASQLAERALKLDDSYPPARLVLARLDRFAGRLAEAESRARALVNSATSDPWWSECWYELAETLDRLARYDEAMEALLEAKALVRPAVVQHTATLQRIQARLHALEGMINASVLERWAAAAESLQPLRRFAILCGHPRSGTTLLEQVLDSHPGVMTAEETQIFHDEAYLPLCGGFSPEASVFEVLESAPLSRLRQSRADYFRFTESMLGKTVDDRMLIDKNPALSSLIPAAARIFPEVKFLIALRDPRDVCLSCFMQSLSPNPISSSYLSLEGTVTQYLSVMGFWRALLPRLQNPFDEVRYEELVDDLEGTSRKALGFLGVPWDERVLRFDEHARSKSVGSPSYAEVVKPVSKRAIGRWQNYRRHLEPYLERLEPMVKALGYA
jgi:tetratricopeptide (TPR) repeat protein